MQRKPLGLIGMALIWLMLLPAAPAGSEPLYQIDLIVFALKDPALRSSERWPDSPGQPVAGGITTPGTSAVISPKEGSLAAEWDHLESSGRYKPLSYFRWRQLVGSPGQPSRAMVESTARVDKKYPEVTGTLSLIQGDTLRADLDLVLSEKAVEGGTPGQYRLRESRVVREGTLHYFDHPVFGALLHLSPVR